MRVFKSDKDVTGLVVESTDSPDLVLVRIPREYLELGRKDRACVSQAVLVMLVRTFLLSGANVSSLSRPTRTLLEYRNLSSRPVVASNVVVLEDGSEFMNVAMQLDAVASVLRVRVRVAPSALLKAGETKQLKAAVVPTPEPVAVSRVKSDEELRMVSMVDGLVADIQRMSSGRVLPSEQEFDVNRLLITCRTVQGLLADLDRVHTEQLRAESLVAAENVLVQISSSVGVLEQELSDDILRELKTLERYVGMRNSRELL
jgi:hypothetical protein